MSVQRAHNFTINYDRVSFDGVSVTSAIKVLTFHSFIPYTGYTVTTPIHKRSITMTILITARNRPTHGRRYVAYFAAIDAGLAATGSLEVGMMSLDNRQLHRARSILYVHVTRAAQASSNSIKCRVIITDNINIRYLYITSFSVHV